jgi:hypothetical protein
MPIGIDMNNYDISMGTGQIRMSGGGTFTSDNSINYDWILRASPADYSWISVAYGNGVFVAISFIDGSGNQIMTSPDGINWTLVKTTNTIYWRTVCFGTPNGSPLFVIVGNAVPYVYTSPNGIDWTLRTLTSGNDTTVWLNVIYAGGTINKFVAPGLNGTNRLMYSSDGISWTAVTGNTDLNNTEWQGIAYDNSNNRLVITPFYTTGAYYSMYSINGTTWTRGGSFPGYISNVYYGKGLFVSTIGNAVGGTGTGGQQLISRITTSPDGITWTNRYTPDIGWAGIAYGSGIFVAITGGGGNRTMTSSDGINWTLRPSANDSIVWRAITYGNGIFVAVASSSSGNRVMTLDPAYGMSINKITTEETTTNLVKFGQNGATISANPSKNFTWVARSAPEANGWHACCYGNGQFVAVAFTGTNRVMTSTDGYTWTAQTPPANNWLNVCYGELSGNNLYVAVSHNGTNRSMYSTNGISWTTSPTPNDASMEWGCICFGYDTSGNGLFVGTAINGTTNLPRVMTSSNGINWTPRNASDNALSWRGVCYGYDSSGQGQFVAVAQSGTGSRSMYSINGGVTWVGKPTTEDNSSWYNVCYGNGTFVAVAAYTGPIRKRVMYTRNIIGAGWSEANYPVENDWWGVAFGNGLFVAIATSGVGNRVMTSPDGINWTIRASVADSIWKGICYGNGTFVSVSSNGTVMTNDYTANDNTIITNGKLGIGSISPSVALDVNGSARIMENIQMGTSTNSYRRFTMGGGNSFGYLYSAFNQLGDGIHMGYNAYNDNTSWKLHATGFGSGTSRISMGYGYIALYTAPEGSTPPTTLGLYQNSSGQVGIGTSSPTATLNVRRPGGTNAYAEESVLNVKGADYTNGDGSRTVYSAGITLHASDLVWAPPNRTYGAKIYIGGGYSVGGGLGYNGPITFDTAGSERMRVHANGYVGIGTTSPTVPLRVEGSGSSPWTGSHKYTDLTNNWGTSSSTGTISISASNGIDCQFIRWYSDKRIKTNINPIINSLEKLRKLKCCEYEHIDKTSCSKPRLGFIAQEVHEVLPYSIGDSIEYIPNIYEFGIITDNIITLTNKTTIDICCNLMLQIVDDKKDIFVNIDEIIDNKSFSIKLNNNENIDSSNNKIFIYGQQIKDFKSINYNEIFTLTTASVKEMDIIIQEQQEMIENQKSMIESLQKQLQTFEQRLSALESK